MTVKTFSVSGLPTKLSKSAAHLAVWMKENGYTEAEIQFTNTTLFLRVDSQADNITMGSE